LIILLDAEISPKGSPKGRAGAPELYTSNRRPVTKAEIENTLQLAQAACTDESLLVTMRPSHVYKRFFVVNYFLPFFAFLNSILILLYYAK
jgi:hypothetical protein